MEDKNNPWFVSPNFIIEKKKSSFFCEEWKKGTLVFIEGELDDKGGKKKSSGRGKRCLITQQPKEEFKVFARTIL